MNSQENQLREKLIEGLAKVCPYFEGTFYHSEGDNDCFCRIPKDLVMYKNAYCTCVIELSDKCPHKPKPWKKLKSLGEEIRTMKTAEELEDQQKRKQFKNG